MSKLLILRAAALTFVLLPAIFGQAAMIKTDIEVNSVAKFDVKTNRNRGINFSPKGTYFYALDDNGMLSVWDADTFTLRYSLKEKPRHVYLSPDDRFILAIGKKENRIIDAQSGNVNATFDSKIDKWWRAEISADGNFVAAWSRFTIQIFDTQTGKLKRSLVLREWKRKKLAIRRFFDTGGAFLTIKFTPDSQRILTVTGEDDAKLWDIETGQIVFTFTQKTYSQYKWSTPKPRIVHDAQISPDGKWIMTASDSDARLWDASTGKLIHEFDCFRVPRFSPDSRHLGPIYSGQPSTTVFDLDTMKPLTLDSKYAGWFAYWSPDGRTVLTDRTIDEVNKQEAYMWDLATGKQLWSIKTHAKYCFNLVSTCISDLDRFEFSPNGKILLSSNNKQVKLLDPITGRMLTEIADASGPAYWSRNGKYILAREKQADRIGIWELFVK